MARGEDDREDPEEMGAARPAFVPADQKLSRSVVESVDLWIEEAEVLPRRRHRPVLS